MTEKIPLKILGYSDEKGVWHKTEQTFEEQFPSLKGKVERRGTIIHQDISNQRYGTEYITTLEIQEHCLDKQKVRDAIEKNIEFSNGMIKTNSFKEELGL